MNKTELNMIKTFPKLNKSKITKLIDEHNDQILKEEERNITDFERLLLLDKGNNVLELLRQLPYYVLYVDSNTPKELFKNKRFIELIINASFFNIQFIPDDLITPEVIKMLVNCLKNKNPNLFIYSVPNKIFESKEICDLFLNSCSDNLTYSVIMDKISRVSPNYLIDAFNIGLRNNLKIYLNNIDYSNYIFFRQLFSNNRYLDLLNDNSVSIAIIESLYNIDKNLALMIFRKTAEFKKIKLSSNIGIPYIKIIPDKEFVKIIFDYDIYDYFWNYLDKLDIDFFTPEYIEKLLTSKRSISNSLLESVYKNTKFLSVIAKIRPDLIKWFSFDSINDYISSFEDISLINNNIIEYALNHGTNFPGTIKSSLLLKYILELPNPKDLNILNNEDNYTKYLCGFSKESFNEENLKMLLELQKVILKRKGFSIFELLSKDVLSDKRIFNYLLENIDGELSQHLLFFEDVIDENNFDIFTNKLEILDNIVVSDSMFKSHEMLNFIFNKLNIKDFICIKQVKYGIGNKSSDIFSNISLNESNVLKLLIELIDYEIAGNINFKNVEDNTCKIISISLWLLSEIKNKNITSNEIEEKKKILLDKINELLSTIFGDKKITNDYIIKAINGHKNPFNIFYADNIKKLRFMTYICEFKSENSSLFIDNLPYEVINKINTKQLNNIINLLKQLNVSEDNIIKLAINIYMTIGYERAVDLLTTNPQKNYGVVDENILNGIFNNINLYDIMFEQKGKGYVPVLNEKLINIIFGSNNKIKNTPIRNFLNNYSDKEEEINRNIERLKKDLSLTPEERETKISEYQKQLETYKDNIKEFFKNIGKCFIEWDIIEEEFIKKQNKSKLELKINISSILDILKNIKSIRGDLDEIRDSKLIESDVFEYVGYDTQFTIDPEHAPLRAVTLSRQMEDNYTKKFPNISILKGKYTIRVYHPQDRRLLSAGYRSGCCFRPNGNADNSGNNNSLLRYCATNEYGGGVEIVDNEGNTIMFSPLLRNGNVLMIHSIETKHSPIPSECNELLKEFADKVIDESTKNGDNISYVVITDLHYLDTSITEGTLSTDKKFKIYDPTGEYAGMYNNLDRNHMILSHSKEKKVDDISYGEVTSSYQFEKENVFNQFEVNNELVLLCSNLDSLKNEIIVLSNRRQTKLKNGNELESYELLKQIREKKATYNSIYKQILSMKKGKDYYKETKNIIYVFSKYCKDLNYTDLVNYSQIMYSSDWYIAIRTDGVVEYNCLDSGYDELLHYLRNLKETSNYVIKNEELLSK